MTLTELKYIRAVARHRHFGRAAESCFVSQPTLSVAVRKLEEELGVTLFERRKQEVTVTPIGEQVVAQAEVVLNAAEAVKGIALAGQDQVAGPLSVGFIYTIGPYLLPNLIPALKRDVPQMPLRISEDFTDVLLDRLKHGDLDVAVLALPIDDSDLVSQAVYREPFVAAVPADHALAERGSVTPEILTDDTMLLLASRNCFRDQVLATCPSCVGSRQKSSLQRTLEGSSLETIRHMTAAGAGVTVLPILATTGANADSELVRYVPFAAPVPERVVGVAYRRSFPRPQAVHALVRAIKACVGDVVIPEP